MKKNLRIVSAAAAALLAVAPVAATAVSTVSADAITSANQLGNVPALNNGTVVNVKPNISLNTSAGTSGFNGIKATISVSFTATVDGTTATSTFNPQNSGQSDIKLYHGKTEITNLQDVSADAAGSTYRVTMTQVGLNFGTQNANKEITLTFPKGDYASWKSDDAMSNSIKVTLDQNGTVVLSNVAMNVTAKDFSNPAVVTWFNRANNAPVTSGSLSLYAGSDAGKMNVAQVQTAAQNAYGAANYAENSALKENSHITYTNNLKDALKSAGVEVDAQGWFVAPKSFTFNMTATASNNDASATLPITVNVPNGKEAASETSVSAKVMYKSAVYNKDLKTTGKTIAGYTDTNFVAENGKLKEFTINGEHFYKIANEDGYVRARNVTGSKMTLKKNAYVYKSNGKKTSLDGKKKITKGTEVTVYGGKYHAIKGYKGEAVRVGVNKYIKVANVNYDLYK